MNDDAPTAPTEQVKPTRPQRIPESLRKQMSEAGKKGIRKMTAEARSRGGRKAWQTRIAKAIAAEKAAAMGNNQ